MVAEFLDNNNKIELLDQYPAKYDHYEWRNETIVIRHPNGDTYEVMVNPLSDWYDPEFGDGKECKCSHTYYRHFDSYSRNMDPVGCKYCDCSRFH